MAEREVVIVSAGRSPFGRHLGAMKDVSIIELGVKVMSTVIQQAGIQPSLVEEAYVGNCFCFEAEDPSIVGRQIALKAGLRPEVVTATIDTACTSSMLAIRLGYQSILLGRSDIVVAGGVESLSRMGYVVPPVVRWGKKLGGIQMEDPSFPLGYKEYQPVAVDAGNMALEFNVSREEQDQWAERSQKRYSEAFQAKKFRDEIIPIEVPLKKKETKILDADEQPRPDTTIKKLSKLRTIFGSPTVTAGNAPGLNDGGAMVVIMSGEKAKELGLSPLGKIVWAGGRSGAPNHIATVPGYVIQECLQKSGMKLDEMDLIEINEAFAAMPLVSSLVLTGKDRAQAVELRKKINVNGGAIAIGHPIGASGARVVMTLLYELRRRGGGTGIAAICGGLAQSEGMIIESFQ